MRSVCFFIFIFISDSVTTLTIIFNSHLTMFIVVIESLLKRGCRWFSGSAHCRP